MKVIRALVLVSPEDWNRLQRGERASGAWGFFLEPLDDTTTRFVIRSSGGAVGTHLFDAVHFLMEQKMMRGLRRRAERLGLIGTSGPVRGRCRRRWCE